MKKLLVLALAACGGTSTPNSAVPWLRGFTATATAVSDNATSAASSDEADYGGLQVTADVAPTDGTETVLASYRRGVRVVDRSGKLLARVPGFDPTGSADDLVALSVGDAGIGIPVIALAVTRGGHRESVTSIVLYRVGSSRLDLLFEGPVEETDGTDTFTGTITFVPGGLQYRAPRATSATVWVFDAASGRYVQRTRSRSVRRRPARILEDLLA
jgi:hypothetical protein